MMNQLNYKVFQSWYGVFKAIFTTQKTAVRDLREGIGTDLIAMVHMC